MQDTLILPTVLCLVLVCAASAQTTQETFKLPPLPAHPRLLLTDAEMPKVKDRIEKDPALKARFETMVRSADGWTARKVDLPDRGGQWYHYYACKKDGAQFKTVSPTEHKCPVCGTVYTGWPYDDVVLSSTHNGYSNAVRDLGLVYRLTGQAKYADKAREILLAYAEKYLKYPLHNIQGKEAVGGGRVGPQTLDESTWLIPVCQGADLIWDRLSDGDRKKIEHDLLRPAAQVIRQHKMGIHNIQCWKNSAVGLVGLLLDDAELVADAVASPHGFQAQIAKGVNDDGQWYEGAWGYHFYTMNAIVPLTEAGQRCGLRLYAYESEGRSFRKLFVGPLDLAMPNMVLPAFSDSGQVNVIGQHPLYEIGMVRYGEARFAEVLRKVKRDTLQAMVVGVFPLPDSKPRESAGANFTGAGYAVLQQGTDANATWLCLKYGPHGGGHGHPDKLSFILYSRQEVIGYDPGTGRYGVPLHAEWQKTTIAHNTLTVDQANQKPTTGKCLAFVCRPDWGGAFAEAGPIYDGVTYRRAAAVIGQDLVIVLDMVSADKDHALDLAYHHAGAWTAPPRGEPVKMPDKIGYKYLEGMTKPAGALPTIKTNSLVCGLAVAGAQPTEVWIGTGAGSNTSERVPCVVAHVKGKEAAVAWAIHLGGAAPTVKVSQNGSTFTAEATVNGKTHRLIADAEGTEKLKME
jgi:hypothetical protein